MMVFVMLFLLQNQNTSRPNIVSSLSLVLALKEITIEDTKSWHYEAGIEPNQETEISDSE